jgi:putative membrane protein
MFGTLIATLAHDYGDRPGWAGPWLLFLWLIPLAVGFVIWRVTGGRRSPTHDAAAALAGRYARGEIDETEYRQRLGVLQEKNR